MAPTTLTVHSTPFTLRRATETDLDAIVALLSNDPLRRAEMAAGNSDVERYRTAFRTINADPAHYLAVVTDEKENIVATMQLTLLPGLARAAATRLNIEAVRVDEALRGQGLGSAMIAWAIEHGRHNGATLVQLTSDKARPEAHAFYERLGFEASHTGFKQKL
ncbi:GNAT family N-acetyltransferase [Microbacterium sp. YY-01]|uniref:GNAT family N-acetyltransferase n=1 Tax=Microbacterium sp. YY-01 TaxID=3421634 RepID=UPI003D16BE2E